MSDTHEFEVLEDNALAALEPLKAEGLRTLEPYSGELELDEIAEITARFPCIYAVAGGMGLKHINLNADASLEMILFVGDRNVRSHTAAARGDASSPGVYRLLYQAREILDGRKLVPGFSPFRGTGEYPLAYRPKDHMCIYIATYRANGAR